MGRATADGFAEAVADGQVSLDAALHHHLRANHYPPVPTFMVQVAKDALAAYEEEGFDALVDLPIACSEHGVVLNVDNGDEHSECGTEFVVQWRNRDDGKVRAGDVIESFHLDSFL